MRFIVPQFVTRIMEAIRKSPDKGAQMRLLDKQRRGMEKLTANLVGIAANQAARDAWELALDKQWAKTQVVDADEVVVGGGYHAAVYAAGRCNVGREKPLVLDQGQGGGTFAMSRAGSFYLNSRNRPGKIGLPGSRGSLNAIPNGPVQPADLSVGEYQRNSDIAFSIRATLALCANVRTGVTVVRVDSADGRGGQGDRRYEVVIRQAGSNIEESIYTDRVIMATGIGKESKISPQVKSDRYLTYSEFMKKLDEPFPFQGMQRVAVIGVGDGGKTVVEALAGQGPSCGLSSATLDWVEQIDWYGLAGVVENLGYRPEQFNRDNWERCARPRYRGIGRLLPVDSTGSDQQRRLWPRERASQISGGFECAYVNERPYDYVIDCSGYTSTSDVGGEGVSLPDFTASRDFYEVDGRQVARRVRGEQIFWIGPSAQIPLSDLERRALPSGIDENSVAMFRYALRTNAFASVGLIDGAGEVIALDADGDEIREGQLVYSSNYGEEGIVIGRAPGYSYYDRSDSQYVEVDLGARGAVDQKGFDLRVR